MAIQNRRGIFSDLDPTKLLPGEYAVVISGDPDNTDGNGVYICFAPGQVKKIALTEDTSLDGKVYPELTAGDIFADTYAENKIPYFFRPSGGGSEVGTIEAPVLVGGSIGYNQLVPNTGSSLSVTVTSGHKYVMKKNGTLSVGSSTGSALTGLTGGSDMVTDLTLELGTAVADRVYTLEQSTSGSGIAQLRAWGFDFGTYIPYCAPTLKHVEGVSAHKFVGFNQWDEEWESGLYDANGNKGGNTNYIRSTNFIPCLPSTLYCFTKPSGVGGNICEYDASGVFIKRTGMTSSQISAGYYTFTTTDGTHKITFSLGGSSTPQTTYNHDICINLSSSKNGTYEPYRTWSYALDSTLTLRGVPKLGANNQLYYDGDTYEPDGTVTRNCAIRAYQSGDESLADAITDGTNTVYKLSTPTTETAEPYTQYQEVDANGTEEYVSTGVVPVGHDTKYPTDLKGAFESILSAIPSANGTYALKVTVANGKKTFSWV